MQINTGPMASLKWIVNEAIRSAGEASQSNGQITHQLQAIQNLQSSLAQIISAVNILFSSDGMTLGSGLLSSTLFAVQPLNMQLQATPTSVKVTFAPALPWGDVDGISLISFDIKSITIEQTQITFEFVSQFVPLPPIVIPVQS